MSWLMVDTIQSIDRTTARHAPLMSRSCRFREKHFNLLKALRPEAVLMDQISFNFLHTFFWGIMRVSQDSPAGLH
jgi:hypothetical protein